MSVRSIERPQRIGAVAPLLVLSTVAVAVVAGNTLLTVLAIAALAVIWNRTSASPVRTIIAVYLSYQWLQASMKIWLANFAGIDLSVPQKVVICENCELSVFYVTPTTLWAVVLALAGIAAVALGARWFEARVPRLNLKALDFSPSRLLVGYLVLLVVDRISGPYVGGGLAQPLIALGSLKFAFAVLLTYYWVNTGRGVLPLLCVVTIELTLGFTGYFADFKTILIVAGTAVLTSPPSDRKHLRPLIAGACILLIVLGSAWTVIKPAYRSALSEGTKTQTVTIDMGDRLQALGNLFGKIDLGGLRDGFAGMAMRIAYVDILADVLQRVPQVRPYEFGALWGEALASAVTPRFIFSDKPVLRADSERTMFYTGKWFGSDAEGTSVSIGYVGDSYIDFGILGGIAIPFGLGALYAVMARHILALGRRGDLTVHLAVLIVLLRPVQLFETSNVKLLPGILWAWIVCGIAVAMVWPRVRRFFVTTQRAHRGVQLRGRADPKNSEGSKAALPGQTP